MTWRRRRWLTGILFIVLTHLIHVTQTIVQYPPCGSGDFACECAFIRGTYFSLADRPVSTDGGATSEVTYSYPLPNRFSLPAPIRRVQVLNWKGVYHHNASTGGGGGGGPIRFFVQRGASKVLIGSVDCSGLTPQRQTHAFHFSIDDFEEQVPYGTNNGPAVGLGSNGDQCFPEPIGQTAFLSAQPNVITSALFSSSSTPASATQQWRISVENIPNDDYVVIERVPDIRVCSFVSQTSYVSSTCSRHSPQVNAYVDHCGQCVGDFDSYDTQLHSYVDITPETALTSGMTYGTCVDLYNSTAAVGQCPCAFVLPAVNTVPFVWTRVDDVSWGGTALPDIFPGKGQSVAISDNYVMSGNVVGTPPSTHFHVKTPSPPYSKLYDLGPESVGGQYGHDVAVDENIDYMAVSNPMAVTPTSGGDGAVYIYRTFSPLLQQTIVASHGGLQLSNNTNGFGWRCGESISMRDGLLAIGCAEYTDVGGTGNENVGVVMIFRIDTMTGMYSHEQTLYSPSGNADEFFGYDVSIQNKWLVVGTRFNTAWLVHEISPAAWVFLPVQGAASIQPPNFAPSPVGEFGASVHVDFPRVSISDRNFLASPSARGKVWLFEFVSLVDLRLAREYEDDVQSFNTQFGTDHAISQNFTSVGAPLSGNSGEAMMIYTYPPPCFDCFGFFPARDVTGERRSVNACGNCELTPHTNAECLGCDGVPNSGEREDFCAVCAGDNTTCVAIVEPTQFSVTCNSITQFQLRHEPAQNSVQWQIVGMPTDGSIMFVPAGDTTSGLVEYAPDALFSGFDSFDVRVEDNFGNSAVATIIVEVFDCVFCDNSTAMFGPIEDMCGVCGGDGTSCLDCFGVPFGGATVDECGVCDGDSTTCLTGVVQSNINVNCDETRVLSLSHVPSQNQVTWRLVAPFATKAFSVSLSNSLKTITYVPNDGATGMDSFGWEVDDNFGNVDSGTVNVQLTQQPDCNGVVCGGATVDACGICGGDGSTCAGCDGVFGSGLIDDVCGVCGGDGSTCADCFGVPGGSATVDACGICDGDGSTCEVALEGVGRLTFGRIWTWMFIIVISLSVLAIVYFIRYCIYYCKPAYEQLCRTWWDRRVQQRALRTSTPQRRKQGTYDSLVL